jgi:hypothetical protein
MLDVHVLRHKTLKQKYKSNTKQHLIYFFLILKANVCIIDVYFILFSYKTAVYQLYFINRTNQYIGTQAPIKWDYRRIIRLPENKRWRTERTSCIFGILSYFHNF